MDPILLHCLIFIIILLSYILHCTHTEVLALSDELEFAAIQAIHSQLDDNRDGNVDLSESEEV